nr:hypothetical protein [Tanacetum cinerariifolium]
SDEYAYSVLVIVPWDRMGTPTQMPRSGIESEQWDHLLDSLDGVKLNPSEDRWSWDLNGPGEFSVASAQSFKYEYVAMNMTELERGGYAIVGTCIYRVNNKTTYLDQSLVHLSKFGNDNLWLSILKCSLSRTDTSKDVNDVISYSTAVPISGFPFKLETTNIGCYSWEKTKGIQQSPLSILKILKIQEINLSRKSISVGSYDVVGSLDYAVTPLSQEYKCPFPGIQIYALVLVFLLSIHDDMEHRLEAASKHFKSGVVGSYTNGDDELEVLDVAR